MIANATSPRASTGGPAIGFADVYRQHYRFVWQSLRCLGVVDSAVADAVQDVFVVVHRRLPEFEGRAAIRTWLFEILRRIGLRYRARAHRDAARSFELPELRGEDDLDAAVDRAIAVELLRAFTDSLDEDRLRVFMLAEFGQLRGREIAEAAGVNINTVYARLRSAHRERDRLASRLRAKEAATMVSLMRRSRPTRAARQRTRMLLAAKLGLSSVAANGLGGATSWVTLKWLGVGVGTAAAGLVLTVAASDPQPQAQGGAAIVEVPARAHVDASVAAAWRGSGGDRHRGSRTPAVGPASVVPTPTPQPTASPGAAAPADPAEPHGPAALAAEVALVQEIRDAEQAGRPVDGALDRYRARFPSGMLRQEVDALLVERACREAARDRATTADAIARHGEFLRHWPDSSLRQRLATICPKQPEQRSTKPPSGRN